MCYDNTQKVEVGGHNLYSSRLGNLTSSVNPLESVFSKFTRHGYPLFDPYGTQMTQCLLRAGRGVQLKSYRNVSGTVLPSCKMIILSNFQMNGERLIDCISPTAWNVSDHRTMIILNDHESAGNTLLGR